jgi:hypothetical protein
MAATQDHATGEMKMKTMTTGATRAVTLGLLLAAPAFGASADPFTWDLSNVNPSLAGVHITADTVSTTDFLVNRAPPTGEGSDQYIMQINGFSLNGAPVPLTGPLAGLNSTFGLYVRGRWRSTLTASYLSMTAAPSR